MTAPLVRRSSCIVLYFDRGGADLRQRDPVVERGLLPRNRGGMPGRAASAHVLARAGPYGFVRGEFLRQHVGAFIRHQARLADDVLAHDVDDDEAIRCSGMEILGHIALRVPTPKIWVCGLPFIVSNFAQTCGTRS